MFKGDEDTFESLFDKLASFCVGDAQPEPGRQTSARTCTRKERPNAMQVAALSKGGKSRSGKGKSVTSFVCNKTDHISRDCFYNKDNSKGKGKSLKASNDAKVECFYCGGNHFGRNCTSNEG